MPLAVVTFDFDPTVSVAGLSLRWETIGTAASILVALLAAALLARAMPPDAGGRRLHLDDLLSIAVAGIPGAIVGGRAGYALVHLDYYSAHPGALLDPAQGGLQLGLGIVGGVVTAAYVARVLDAPIGRAAHVAAIPLLIAIEGGKAAMAAGGTGQGSLSADAWATRYLGGGPWGSLGPELAAHPAQLYEAGVAAGVAVVLLLALAAGGFRRQDGRLLLVALALWLAGRTVVATTWRDPAVLGPLSADQVLSLVLAALSLAGIVGLATRRPRPAGPAVPASWPDARAAESWRGSARG